MEGAAENDAKQHNELSAYETSCATQRSVEATVNRSVAAPRILCYRSAPSSRMTLAIVVMP